MPWSHLHWHYPHPGGVDNQGDKEGLGVALRALGWAWGTAWWPWGAFPTLGLCRRPMTKSEHPLDIAAPGAWEGEATIE